jgi:hypothetical protein
MYVLMHFFNYGLLLAPLPTLHGNMYVRMYVCMTVYMNIYYILPPFL